MDGKKSRLRRAIHDMPEEVRTAILRKGIMKEFLDRPAYQQNDYLGWIQRAKKPETKRKRLQQMLVELETGGVYMGMKHNPSKRT
jgi:uncharacterized protein YdeI (YjbR/CyaY-like superfamily)